MQKKGRRGEYLVESEIIPLRRIFLKKEERDETI
jgi:hypothetical protein